MAGVALDLGVRAPQRIFRVPVVIEANGAPLAFAVAALAGGSVASSMNILYLVTAHANRTNSLVSLSAMACGTGDGTVRIMERKSRRGVIERLDAEPCRLVVALVARLSQAPLVRIAVLMTVKAASRGVAEFRCLRMAAAAGHRNMRVPQREIRESVVKGLAIQLDDIGVPPRVIGVTVIAVLFGSGRPTSMKSLVRGAISGDFLVARKAPAGLRFARERLVALAAVLLELGVPLDDRARQDKLLEQVLRTRA